MAPIDPVVPAPLVGVHRRPGRGTSPPRTRPAPPRPRSRAPPGAPRPTRGRPARPPAAGRWRRCRGHAGRWPDASAGRRGRGARSPSRRRSGTSRRPRPSRHPGGLRSSHSLGVALHAAAQLQQVLAVAAQLAGQPRRGDALGEAAEDEHDLGGPAVRPLQLAAGEGVEDPAAGGAAVVQDRGAVATMDVQVGIGHAARAGQPFGMDQGDELAVAGVLVQEVGQGEVHGATRGCRGERGAGNEQIPEQTYREPPPNSSHEPDCLGWCTIGAHRVFSRPNALGGPPAGDCGSRVIPKICAPVRDCGWAVKRAGILPWKSPPSPFLPRLKPTKCVPMNFPTDGGRRVEGLIRRPHTRRVSLYPGDEWRRIRLKKTSMDAKRLARASSLVAKISSRIGSFFRLAKNDPIGASSQQFARRLMLPKNPWPARSPWS